MVECRRDAWQYARMRPARKSFDIAFIGHICFDELVPYKAAPVTSPGSAVLCGAMAAARIGGKVMVVTRMSPRDEAILQPLRDAGVEVRFTPTGDTSRILVVHPSENVDERDLLLKKNAGFFTAADIPELDAECVHLAGISDREFTMDFMRGLKKKGYRLSVDMQSFVRQADPETGKVVFGDVAARKEIVAMMDKVKLDVVEAGILTGFTDLEKAAETVAGWGCGEVVITKSEGVLARYHGRSFCEKFSNSSTIGRTGRGDTTFAGYLVRRLTHNVPESLKFAAALVSIKMETPGPFKGTLDDVLRRMKERH